jgi:hypothetical protein
VFGNINVIFVSNEIQIGNAAALPSKKSACSSVFNVILLIMALDVYTLCIQY